MLSNQNVVVLNILKRDYPAIAAAIEQKVSESLPATKLHNLSLVAVVRDEFIKAVNLEGVLWCKTKKKYKVQYPSGESENLKCARLRELFVAVCCMLFQPEKILGIDAKRGRAGLLLEISKATNCTRALMSQSLQVAVVYMKSPTFKNQVESICQAIAAHELIKSETHYLKHD